LISKVDHRFGAATSAGTAAASSSGSTQLSRFPTRKDVPQEVQLFIECSAGTT